jgi:hypothetical protein
MNNPLTLEIDKVYSRIDKIAKKGNDNYIEYSIYVDDLVKKGNYSYLKDCLELKYDFDISFMDIPTVKKESWKVILFNTNTTYQDFIKKLTKSKGVYQQGLDYYKDITLTQATINTITGKGVELKPIIESGGVTSIEVLKEGSGYSISDTLKITGGIGTASGTPIIIAGRITSISMSATGSFHNQSYKLGRIVETDEFVVPITNKISKDLYQRLIKNKTTYLTVTKESSLESATFSNWNMNYSYDKNLSNLYTQAVNYLIS